MVRATKVLLSFWLIYHLFIVLLFPNSQSLLSRKLDRYLLPYANTFNMNTPWQFFSPFPGPKLYIEYEVSQTPQGDDGIEVHGEKYIWPPTDHRDPDWDNWRRRLYSSRFLAMDPNRLKEVFVPWICKKHPKAAIVSVEVIMAPVPNVEKAEYYSRISDMEKPVTNYKFSQDCPGREGNSDSAN